MRRQAAPPCDPVLPFAGRTATLTRGRSGKAVLSIEVMIFLAAGAAAGGFISGLAGTGTALFSLGLYLVVLEPLTAVAVVALMSALTGVQGLWVVRTDILARPRRLARFLVPGLLGVPFGVALLSFIDAGQLRISVACMLILYGAFFGLRTRLPKFDRPTPGVDIGIGLVGGVLGGAAALSGALPTMYLSLRSWTKSETRAVLQPYNFAILLVTVVLLAWRGAYDREAWLALLVTIPVGILAAQIGIFVFRRLSDGGFRRLLILLTLVMGLGVLGGELF